MIEATDQIQTPAVPNSPFPEALPETLSQPAVPNVPQPDAILDESMLTAEIAQLWQVHADFKTSLRQQSQNLHSLRAELGKKLSEMKQILARPGRNGLWSSWLKERRIPRATADRLALKFERSLNPDGNRLTESISEPTEEEIQNLLDKVEPKLRRALRTPASVYRFIELLASSFALDRKDTEEGFVIVRPCQQVSVVDSLPAEPSVEPASLGAEALVGANSVTT